MKQIKKEIEFLEYAYSEILMEKDTYSSIVKKDKELKENKVLNDEFRKYLISVIEKFNKFLNAIKIMLKNRKYDKEQSDLVFRMATYMTLDLEKSNESEIITHLIHGSQVVLNNFESNYYSQKELSKTINNLAERFIKFENELIISLKSNIDNIE